MTRYYSYDVNESTNEMTIWEDDYVLCTISDVKNDKNAKNIFYEVVYELRGIDLEEEE